MASRPMNLSTVSFLLLCLGATTFAVEPKDVLKAWDARSKVQSPIVYKYTLTAEANCDPLDEPPAAPFDDDPSTESEIAFGIHGTDYGVRLRTSSWCEELSKDLVSCRHRTYKILPKGEKQAEYFLADRWDSRKPTTAYRQPVFRIPSDLFYTSVWPLAICHSPFIPLKQTRWEVDKMKVVGKEQHPDGIMTLVTLPRGDTPWLMKILVDQERDFLPLKIEMLKDDELVSLIEFEYAKNEDESKADFPYLVEKFEWKFFKDGNMERHLQSGDIEAAIGKQAQKSGVFSVAFPKGTLPEPPK